MGSTSSRSPAAQGGLPSPAGPSNSLHGASRGIPRIINHLCDQTPLAASIRESDEFTSWDPRRAVREF